MNSLKRTTASEYKENLLQRLESGFVQCIDLLSVKEYNEETDKEGFHVIPSAGDGVIGRYYSLKDMEIDTPNIIVRKSVYSKLCAADRALKRKRGYENCQIIVTYGYRRPEIQKEFYDATYEKKRNENPLLSEEKLREAVHREIAFPEVAGHPTGGAVDVILFDYKNGKFLDFGTEICQFDSKNIYYGANDISDKARRNRRTLRTIMCQQGFAPYDGEWWHFCYGDREWAYYTYRRKYRQGVKIEKKALYRQKKYEEISEIAYNDKVKKSKSSIVEQSCVRLAIQKDGRLTEETLSILKKSGIVITRGKREILVKSDNFPLEILFVRDDDISNLVDKGVADIGVVGENVYRENFVRGKNRSLIKRYLGFGNCFLALAVPNDSNIEHLQDLNGKSIATSFPRLTRRFLENEHIKADIINITGSVEVAPVINYADAIVDLVSTGSSLQQNNLHVLFHILDSQSILIANCHSDKDMEKKHIIEQLLQRIDSYLIAKKYKYVNMIIPQSQVSKIVEIINGIGRVDDLDDYDESIENNLDKNVSIDMRVPVVYPMYGYKEWCSLQTIMKQSDLWNKMDELKENGAINIVFYSIEGIIDETLR